MGQQRANFILYTSTITATVTVLVIAKAIEAMDVSLVLRRTIKIPGCMIEGQWFNKSVGIINESQWSSYFNHKGGNLLFIARVLQSLVGFINSRWSLPIPGALWDFNVWLNWSQSLCDRFHSWLYYAVSMFARGLLEELQCWGNLATSYHYRFVTWVSLYRSACFYTDGTYKTPKSEFILNI